MGRVIVVTVDDVSTAAFPTLPGLAARGKVASKGVFATPDRPLWLWMHEMDAGSEIQFQQPPVGHVLYVWKGSISVNQKSLEEQSAVCVEHQGAARILAGNSGATVLHYHSQKPHPTQGSRAGGQVHIVGKDGIHKVTDDSYYDTTTTVWMDSACPTCHLWFHQSQYETAYPQSHSHYHSEDEIIFVVQGGLVFGRRILKPGTALGIDAGTVYGFGVDQGGLAFINFRPVEPHFVMMSRDGPKHAPISEYDLLKKGTPVLPHV